MNEQNQRRRRRTGVEIEQMLARYHRIGLTQVRFAEQEGICLATLTRHLKKARSLMSPAATSTSPVRFVEVERGAELLANGAALRAERRDSYRLRFNHKSKESRFRSGVEHLTVWTNNTDGHEWEMNRDGEAIYKKTIVPG